MTCSEQGAPRKELQSDPGELFESLWWVPHKLTGNKKEVHGHSVSVCSLALASDWASEVCSTLVMSIFSLGRMVSYEGPPRAGSALCLMLLQSSARALMSRLILDPLTLSSSSASELSQTSLTLTFKVAGRKSPSGFQGGLDTPILRALCVQERRNLVFLMS